MTTSADADFIHSLDSLSQQLNRYLALIIFIFGTLGNTLNCLVLSQRKLRSNPCALLFLVSSFVDLISILVGLTTRIMAGWNDDPTATITWICKCRAFVVFSTRTMAIWMIMLATIDRWLLSSVDVHRRQMSTLKNVKMGMLIVVIISVVSYVHMLYCYEANITDAPLKCYGQTNECRLVTDLIYALVTIAIPLIIMMIFGVMTISNVHRVRTRVHHRENEIPHKHHVEHKYSSFRKTDHHLIRMLLVEVIYLIILCVPQAIQKFYTTFKPFGSGSPSDDALKAFLYNIELLLAFVASSMPFYVYTLAGGTIFRKAFWNFIRTLGRKITCQYRF